MESYITLIGFFTFLIGSALGAFVYFRQPKNKIFQAFGITALGMIGWNLSIFLVLSGIGPTLILARLVFSFGVLLLTGFALFVFRFPYLMKGGKALSFLYEILGIFFFILPLTPWFVSHVEVINGNITGDLNPLLFGISTLFYFTSCLFTFVILLARTLKVKGVDRKRLGFVLIGFSLFLFPMLTTQLFLPLVFNDFRFNNLGPAFSIFLVIFIANAILRYRLLNIRWIVGKGILFTALATLVVWAMTTVVFLISNTVSSRIAIGVGALVIVLVYKPIQRLIEQLINKLVNQGWYDPEVATKELFDLVRTESDLEHLVGDVSKRFIEYFSLKELAVVVFASESRRIQESYIHGFNRSMLKHVKEILDVVKDYNYEIVELNELKWRLQYGTDEKLKMIDQKNAPILEKVGAQTIIPLMLEDSGVGFIIFGKRRYDNVLRPQDISFLKLVSAGISPALENAAKFAQIKNLYSQLSEADRVKSEFINIVSHRFRTPLSAVRWNIETILDTAKLGKPVKEMLTDSLNRTVYLVHTLDGLFDVLAIENDRLKLDPSQFRVKESLEGFIDSFGKRVKEKGVAFSAEIDDVKLYADEKRFQFICVSLLQNALLFTNEGLIDFRVSKKGKDLLIEVKDTGIGIPTKDKKHIFKKFFRGGNAVSQSVDGQGISLYLVKKVIDLHKGSIDFDSTANKGTDVRVLLPLSKQKKAEKPKKATKKVKKKK